MNNAETATTLHASRLNHACLTCRKRKVKCSGTTPCNNCTRRSDRCVYDKDGKKISIPEKAYLELKRKAKNHNAVSTPSQRRKLEGNPKQSNRSTLNSPSHQSSGSGSDHPTPQSLALGDGFLLSNPLATKQRSYLTDDSGRKRFLGPSSTWAYSQRLMTMVKSYISSLEAPQIPHNPDGHAFPLNSTSGARDRPLTANELPSLDYAIYLVNTVNFHICQLYHVFDEDIFMKGLSDFYNNEMKEPQTPRGRIWYTQFLLILSFGKALVVQDISNGAVPGSTYFTRAVDTLPKIQELYADVMTSMEVLSTIALYLQSLDHRNSAYIYLGMALRMALTQGLHRDFAADSVPPPELERQRCIWWTIYVLDRKISSLMGAPSSIRDEDTTVQLPDFDNVAVKARGLSMHVKLSRLLAMLINTVYGIDGLVNVSFLKTVQEILRSLASLAPELEQSFRFQLNEFGTTSRVAATLNLCYHQCVVLAVRPLLMCLLSEKLERYARQSGHNALVEPVKVLLKTCTDSSLKSIRILGALNEQHLLETFLPFDLECLFSSMFVHLVSSAVGTTLADGNSAQERGQALLDTMIRRGSPTAKFRSSELSILSQLLHLAEMELGMFSQPSASLQSLSVAQQATDDGAQDELYQNSPIVLSTVGLSPKEMEFMANHLEWNELFQDTDEPLLSGAFWQPNTTNLPDCAWDDGTSL